MNTRKIKRLEKELDMVCRKILHNFEKFRKGELIIESESEKFNDCDGKKHYDWGLAAI